MTAPLNTLEPCDSVLDFIRDGMVDELIESEARFRALATAITDALILFSEQGITEFANAAAERMFGCGSQEMIGQDVKALMATASVESFQQCIEAISRQSSGLVNVLTAKHSSGREFPVEISLSRVSVRGRTGIAGLFRDVTQRCDLEEQLRAAERASQAESERKSEFMRQMNHHLRTPLTPIIGYAELLLDEKLTDHQKELVAGIQRNAEQLLIEVSSLLDAACSFDSSRLSGPANEKHQQHSAS